MRITKTLRIAASLITAGLACTPYAVAAPVVVKIGFAGPLTGNNAGYGKDLQNGVTLALEDARSQRVTINGQDVQFQIVAEDDQADPRTGVEAAQKLVDEGVAVVIGHFNSGTTIPASAIYEKAGIPDLDPAATNPVLTHRGFKNMFMVIPTDAQNAGNAGNYAVTVTKAHRIAILDDRTAFGQGEADEFEKSVKAHRGTIVTREYTSSQAVDFRTQLTNIKSAGADLVFFGGLDAQAADIAKQMRQLGLRAQLVGGGGVHDDEFIKLAGDAAEGAMAWEYGRPLGGVPAGKTFAQRYRQRFGTDVLAYAQFGYDAAWTAIKAMQVANSTAPNVYRPALRDISFNGITGHIAFNPDGSLKNGASTLYQVKHGSWVPIISETGT